MQHIASFSMAGSVLLQPRRSSGLPAPPSKHTPLLPSLPVTLEFTAAQSCLIESTRRPGEEPVAKIISPETEDPGERQKWRGPPGRAATAPLASGAATCSGQLAAVGDGDGLAGLAAAGACSGRAGAQARAGQWVGRPAVQRAWQWLGSHACSALSAPWTGTGKAPTVALDLLHHIQALHHLAKHHMLAVPAAGSGKSDVR